ncbi:MAG: site-2 protease family protein [Pseudomonadota bacterium]
MPEYTLIQKIALYALPALFAITLHEAAHGYAALRLGDRTAQMLGRLTLNPLKHIDPIGTVVVPLVLLLTGSPALFGWAKPVPIGVRNFKNPRTDMVWVAAAGPASNLAMALGWAIVLKLSVSGLVPENAALPLASMAYFGVTINAVLAVFNMLPIPPLDGGRVLAGLVPPNVSDVLSRIEPFGMFIVFGLLYLQVLWTVVGPGVRVVRVLLLTAVGL